MYFTYDANGTKLRKITWDSVARRTTFALYLNGFVYQYVDTIPASGLAVDTLQYVGHEEGRARWAFHKYSNGTTGYGWEYDFIERDHLGNTRVLLTQQKDTAGYRATMEGATRATENALFYNIPSTIYAWASVPGYPVDTSMSSPNDSVAKLNGNGPKQGPAIILKVMSGDKVDILSQYYYNGTGPASDSAIRPADVLNSLASGIVSMTGPAHGSFSQLTAAGNPLSTALSSFITNKNPIPSGKPNAYLNWVLLDNQFNYVSSSSGAMPVVSSGTASGGVLQTPLASLGIPMTKSGYLYIYVSNATKGWDVFFDNLTVKTYSGPMLEENHYYPGGLVMAGISDRALKTQYAENKYKFGGKELQNKEFADGTGLEEYDYGARMYDQQLVVFHNLDPKADQMRRFSPYAFAFDNPSRFVDADGKAPTDIVIHGPDAQKAVTELSKSSNLQLKLDDKGKVVITGGTATTTYDKELKTAIEDKSVEVNLYTTKDNSVTLTNGGKSGDLVVGAYGGSQTETRVDNINENPELAGMGEAGILAPATTDVAVTEQHINIDQAAKEGTVGGVSTGQNIFHEAMESYYSAKSTPGDTQGGPGYLPAHNKAIASDPGYKNMTYGYDPSTKTYFVQNPTTGARVNLFSK